MKAKRTSFPSGFRAAAAVVALLLAAASPGTNPWGTGAALADGGFVTGLPDVPIMGGMTPLGDTLVFDKPGGRIAEAVLTGPVAPAAVNDFYIHTLPQLGWHPIGGAGRFARENEMLTVHISGAPGGGQSTARLVIQPKR